MAMTPEFQAFMEEHFSLDNYTAASELDLQGWYNQFMKRHFIKNLYKKNSIVHLDFLDKKTNNQERNRTYKSLKKEIIQIFTDPLHVSNSSWWNMTGLEKTPLRDWQAHDYWLIGKEISLRPEAFIGLENSYQKTKENVKILSPKDSGESEVDALEFAGSWLQRSTEARKIDYQPLKYVVDESDLKVNLLYPDEVLKESFSAWLSDARSRTSFGGSHRQSTTKRLFKKSDAERWLLHTTLQYLDLELASIVHNNPLNSEEKAFFLCPNLPIATSGRDKMRTIKKYADEMSDYFTIYRLRLAYEKTDGDV
jgi:hypothetical protein